MWNYKPCRLINCYRIDENSITVVTFFKTIKLNSISKMVWIYSDGKHTVSDIINLIEKQYFNIDREVLYKGVLSILDSLKKRGALISNWDGIYKSELPQEVVLYGTY